MAIASALRAALPEVFAHAPYLLFFAPLFLAGLLFDRSASVLAVLLSTGAAFAFLMAQGGESVGIKLLTTAVFGLEGLTIVYLTQKLRTAMADVARLRTGADVRLREIHHRMKNDLARLQAVVLMERDRIRDADARERLDALIERIGVLGQVYGRLQARGDGTVVDAHLFLEELVGALRLTHLDLQPVDVRVRAEPGPLSFETAAAVGLMVNELVMNAFKYAFPGGRSGWVEVVFDRQGERCALTVRDNGVGWPDGRPPKAGIGSVLIEQLTDQLGGTVESRSAEGVETIVRFTCG